MEMSPAHQAAIVFKGEVYRMWDVRSLHFFIWASWSSRQIFGIRTGLHYSQFEVYTTPCWSITCSGTELATFSIRVNQ
jgi:hypothetical protein